MTRPVAARHGPLESSGNNHQSQAGRPLTVLQKRNLDQNRVQQLISLRFGRMSYSPFTYLRGTAVVQASDLAAGPRTDLWSQLCGDAHLGNFQWFDCIPDRQAGVRSQ